MNKKILTTVVLTTLGVIVAWVHIFKQFNLYFGYEGTFWLANDTIIPHPFLTPCFYGGFGFIIALIFAWKFFKKNPTKKALGWYTLYLLAGTLFAWNFAGRDLISFLSSDGTSGIVGCSGLVISNPYTTACFSGASLFLLAFIVTTIFWLTNKKS